MTLSYSNNVKLQLRRTLELEKAIYNISEATFPYAMQLLVNLDNSLSEYAMQLLLSTYLRGDQSSKFAARLWSAFSPSKSMKDFSLEDTFRMDHFDHVEHIVSNLDVVADQFPVIRSILKDDLQQFQAQFDLQDVNNSFSPPSNSNPIDTLHMSYLDIACYFGAFNICQYLKDNGAKVSKKTLVNTVKSGNLEIYKLFESNNCDLTKLMKIAMNYNRTDIIMYLYDKVKGSVAYLDQAILYRNTKLYLACLKGEEDENMCQMSPLTAAILAGNVDIAKLYIESGYSVTLPDPDGTPGFELAAYNGDLPMIKLLSESDAVDQEKLQILFQICVELGHWQNANYISSKLDNSRRLKNLNYDLMRGN